SVPGVPPSVPPLLLVSSGVLPPVQASARQQAAAAAAARRVKTVRIKGLLLGWRGKRARILGARGRPCQTLRPLSGCAARGGSPVTLARMVVIRAPGDPEVLDVVERE